MPRATDENIKYAERMWPQARPKDFERTGRRYVERATGIEYELCRGNPLLGDDVRRALTAYLVGPIAALEQRK
jgi:hypothetical protein